MDKIVVIKKIGKHIKLSINDEKNNETFIILGIEQTNKILNSLVNISYEITKEYLEEK
jgi:hypothetical protein